MGSEKVLKVAVGLERGDWRRKNKLPRPENSDPAYEQLGITQRQSAFQRGKQPSVTVPDLNLISMSSHTFHQDKETILEWF